MTKYLIRKSWMYVFWLHVQNVGSTDLPQTAFSSNPTKMIAEAFFFFEHKRTRTEKTGGGDTET